MSGFEKFEDESDAENRGDNTTSLFKDPKGTVSNNAEFRNEMLDSNFRKEPFQTW
eukprot:CAMPEP_0205824688 /NCGR_PEP_ID=MMETSP0206-20130828/22188_1 /ASSEMBLY_ACC=CAM_ASM_000279 /TAXON_ID=36767 /ORGANISM="Euplotes focardii, Strain TN1" /LENGTH=54 /DNA_ID=CAMNT_0053123041 /DNA_START=6 /DNA_END=167 /DNA_ORIENTATION=-